MYRAWNDSGSFCLMVFLYTKQFFLYVIIWLIGGSPMNAYLRIDSYTFTENLIADYILQDSAVANIRFPIY